MASSLSSVDICNMALDHLNQGSINSISSPSSKTEVLCARWFVISRRATLRTHTWNFAMERASLPTMSEAPVSKYDTQYQLPADYIRIASIGANNEYTDYAIEGDRLLVNTGGGALLIRYVADQDTTSLFDPLFIETLALHIAKNLAYPITGSTTLVKMMEKKHQEKLGEARTVDGQERKPRRVERSRLKAARQRRGYSASNTLED